MDGVSITKKHSGNCILFHINFLSDELKEHIRANLTSICHGEATVKGSGKGFTYERTLKEFLKRYNSKSPTTQKGMIGELLTHVILLEHLDNFSPATPFFNMEERSIKKGFDILFFDRKKKSVWITEIKSGEGHGQAADSKNKTLLSAAKRDLKTRLTANKSMLWYNAINGVNQTIARKNLKKAVIKLLGTELQESQDEKASSTDQCVILGSVLYRALTDKITYSSLEGSHATITTEGSFKELIVLSFQKATFTKVAKFLKSESNA